MYPFCHMSSNPTSRYLCKKKKNKKQQNKKPNIDVRLFRKY